MIGSLPPVGQRVLLAPRGTPPEFPGMRSLWLNSGTAALALAIRGALELRRGASEVLLPGYGCPDLVAAAVFAGAVPVLMDCGAGDPGFDPAALAAACSERTAAIVAVNFLGIHERLRELAALSARCGVVLIEDCAQWYPEDPPAVPVAARVLSFGRGKPVNLLGGGALLVDEGGRLAGLSVPSGPSMSALRSGAVSVFNSLLRPVPYALVSGVPGTGLGATRYRALDRVAAMDEGRFARIRANVDAWCRRSRWREERITELLEKVEGITLLPRTLNLRAARLLRYPLLCRDGALRDALQRSLSRLGASAFYGVPLAQVEGVPEHFPGGVVSLPGAEMFADRLLTLPLHEGVGEEHLREIACVVARLAAAS
jgi:dTDP-4-amino-4,6-dideoxygalactose transaminase